jgi:amino acid transporter
MATESTATPVTRVRDAGLRRDVGLIGGMCASEGSIIGSGWLFGALFAVQSAGTAGILAWVITGAIFAFLALVYSELGGMYPLAGGTARFQHFAFGSVAGVSFGFFSWLQAAAVAPIECYAVLRYGSFYWHGIYDPKNGNVTIPLGFTMTIVLLAVFTALNFMAVKWLAHTNSGLTWWKVGVPVLAIIVLLFKFHSGNFGAGGGFMPYGWHGVLSAISTAGVAFALLGFEQADQLAGEIKNPQRNLPIAIMGGFLIGTIIYVLLQIVFIGALPPSQLTHGFANISDANILAGPFAGLAGLIGLGWLALILRIDAFISPFGTGLIYQTSTSRVGYGLGRNRYYPPIFTWTDKRGVPWFSLIISFIAGLFFLLPFKGWHSLVSLITGATVLMYAGAPISLAAFRKQVPEAVRPYRMPGAAVVAPLAFVAASFIIYWSGFQTIWKLGVALLIGYVLIAIWMTYDKQRPPLEWKSAQWLPVFLLGNGIISWMGQYGPDNTGRIGNGYDLLILAAFNLAIFYWAVAVRLPRDEMLRIVALEAQRAEAEQGRAPEPPAV